MNFLSSSDSLEILRKMIRIRLFERMCSAFKDEKKVAGPIHTCIGQEASVVGVCHALSQTDVLISTHRSHGSNIAKGADLFPLFSEIFGRSTGCSGGKGGSMHLFDLDVSSIMSTAIVGSGLPLACGTAFAQKYRNQDNLSCVFFGDGASNEGTFHESLNLASAWRLPVLFVLENNNVAVTTPLSTVTSSQNLSSRGNAYDIFSVSADGQNVEDVFNIAQSMVSYIRKEKKPAFLELKVQRYGEHQEGDAYRKVANCGYKDSLLTNIQSFYEDPISIFSEKLLAEEALCKEDLDTIFFQEEQLLLEASRLAESSPLAQSSEALSNVYS